MQWREVRVVRDGTGWWVVAGEEIGLVKVDMLYISV